MSLNYFEPVIKGDYFEPVIKGDFFERTARPRKIISRSEPPSQAPVKKCSLRNWKNTTDNRQVLCTEVKPVIKGDYFEPIIKGDFFERTTRPRKNISRSEPPSQVPVKKCSLRDWEDTTDNRQALCNEFNSTLFPIQHFRQTNNENKDKNDKMKKLCMQRKTNSLMRHDSCRLPKDKELQKDGKNHSWQRMVANPTIKNMRRNEDLMKEFNANYKDDLFSSTSEKVNYKTFKKEPDETIGCGEFSGSIDKNKQAENSKSDNAYEWDNEEDEISPLPRSKLLMSSVKKELRGSGRKKTAIFSFILSNMERHETLNKIDQDKEDAAAAQLNTDS